MVFSIDTVTLWYWAKTDTGLLRHKPEKVLTTWLWVHHIYIIHSQGDSTNCSNIIDTHFKDFKKLAVKNKVLLLLAATSCVSIYLNTFKKVQILWTEWLFEVNKRSVMLVYIIKRSVKGG